MSRLFDRIMAHGSRLSMFDLLDGRRFESDSLASEVNVELAAMLSTPHFAEFARSVRPAGTGLVKEEWEDARVFTIDNVHRYLLENKVSGQDLVAMLTNVSVVPAYELMFVESRCPGHETGATSFGWLVHRQDSAEPGQRWQMTATLLVEWVKNQPVGPIGIAHWFLDEQGRYVPPEGATEPVELFQAPMDPNHPGQLEQLCEPLYFLMADMFGALVMSLGLVHCKNISVEERSPEPKLSRNHERRHSRPLARYSTIDIKPITRALDEAKRSDGGGLGKAFHICRGHFKTFRPESPLFGKLTGQYWWDVHARGNKRHGEVVSDYRVHSQHDSDLIGLVYEKAGDHITMPDPDLAQRGWAAHENTQNLLAQKILDKGLIPLRPAPHEPQYDLAWRAGGDLWVAEVKSTTSANEVRQMRAAIGQVLHYCEQLRPAGGAVRPVIVLENEPRSQDLVRACVNAGITLAWAPDFTDAFGTTRGAARTFSAAPIKRRAEGSDSHRSLDSEPQTCCPTVSSSARAARRTSS